MAKIDVYTTDLHELSAKLKKAEQSLSEVQSLVASAQSGLSMKVAARENIDSRLLSVRTKVVSQNDRVGKMASLSMTAAQEFEDADRRSGEKAQSIFSTVMSGLSKLTNSVGRFLSSISVQRHGAIAGVFLGAGTILAYSPLTALSGLLKDMFKKKDSYTTSNSSVQSSNTQNGSTQSSGGGRHDGAAGGAASKPSAENVKPARPVEKPHVTTEAEKKQVLNEINARYKRLPNSKSGKGFKHRCGALVYQQLNEMGVVKSGESTMYGKDYAKMLAKKGKTASGYTCKGYEGADAFDKLLNANKGKFPITNIVCSFEKGGNFTDPKAGHAMLISKIDESGNVYFVDNTKASNYKAVCMTLAEFKAFYFKKGTNCNGITHLYK